MDELTVLIVDDEPNAVRGLTQILESRDGIRIAGEAMSGPDAVKQIERLQPQVVLLDIQMPEMTGFDVVAELGLDAIPFLVFVTAHQEFALQAFEVHAIDYILKPVDHHRLFAVLDRIRKRFLPGPEQEMQRRVQSLLTTISAGEETRLDSPNRLKVKSRGSVVFLSTDMITHIESAGNYVRYFIDGECYLARSTMNEVQAQLESTSLVRVHRSKIVNIDRILKITPQPQGEFVITLDSGKEVSTGYSYRDKVRSLMGS